MSQIITRGIGNTQVTDAKIASGIDAAKIADGSVSNTEFQYLGGVTSDIQTQFTGKQSTSEKGQANGYASLDGSGKIPVAQLPNSIMEFQGQWNASTNSPTLADGTGNAGDVYRVNVAGSQDLGSGSISFAVGDWVMYSGSVWQKATNNEPLWNKEAITLTGTDITNQYVDLAQLIRTNSLDLMFGGLLQRQTSDYTLSTAGGVTRVTFAGDLATGGNSALIAGDVIYFKYQY